ncbi:MAG: Eco57I restriction-modification methylase domain-containing protein [Candidatus Delongbacteria bacterium]|nr:Eco57I restriction-modification methylase domain-containing protein [Candidatus Delongbacteria bacterium]
MNKDQAARIIRETFENPFNRENFIVFIKNLLNTLDEDKARTNQGGAIPRAFQDYIGKIERIGKYTCENKEIMVFIVFLKKDHLLERARSMQRNFVAWYLKYDHRLKDAALVAFISPEQSDWRFSLVKIDSHLELCDGKPKVVEEITPVRRWSFLVGPNENSHTAQSRLIPLMTDDTRNPTLEQLEEAFNIETVTREFFEQYRELFLKLKEELDSIICLSSAVRDEFSRKQVNTIDFAKKLLGQIIFLYFLQKKGWFGVQRDAPWGCGSKHFLRELFDKKHGDYRNFFNDILEPLFYEALRIDRSHDDHYYRLFNCKIPFLNGGLFDPIKNYDWVHTDILIPNPLFSNDQKTVYGDQGDGIFDVFDRYNFTVKEDEPLEKEVAIDPELLGKAYEKFNAIREDNYDEYKKALRCGKRGEENQFNKQHGVYYTPREIVHYMCQQSLVYYLYFQLRNKDEMNRFSSCGQNQLELFDANEINPLDMADSMSQQSGISQTDLEYLIHYGEHVGENEAHVESVGKETETYRYQLPESIRKNAEIIDEKLAGIKVCDPAIGSGAFPVGMMSEIVRARIILSTFIKDQNRSVYRFKRDCIENSLYGVDIDSGAVEIAKLRLWLSLVVDEDDIRSIKPLPNLDYRIICGDSLLGFPLTPSLGSEIEKLKQQFLIETRVSEKEKLKSEINQKINFLLSESERHLGRSISMDIRVNFSEIFHEKQGFDIVIGNPPYIQLQTDKGRVGNNYQIMKYKTFAKTGDIYCLFYERAYQILSDRGIGVYITSNKWMKAAYGMKLRAFLRGNIQPLSLIDVGPGLFEAATVDTNILFFNNGASGCPFQGCRLDRIPDSGLFEYVHRNGVEISVNDVGDKWEIASPEDQRLACKMETIGVSLKNWNIKINFGIKTGYNEAFIIDGKKRAELIQSDPKSAEIIKPIFRGRDIQKYHAMFADQWLIFIPWHFPLNDDSSIQGASDLAEKAFNESYPDLYQYFISFKFDLMNRNTAETGVRYEWYSLQRCAATYEADFLKEKIIWKRIGSSVRFCYDDSGAYCLDSTCFATGEKMKFLVGVLNSSVASYELFRSSPKTGTGDLILSVQALEPLRVPIPDDHQERAVTQRVDSILNLIQSKDYLGNPDKQLKVREYEKQIDRVVYELYELTEDEIGVIEDCILHYKKK